MESNHENIEYIRVVWMLEKWKKNLDQTKNNGISTREFLLDMMIYSLHYRFYGIDSNLFIKLITTQTLVQHHKSIVSFEIEWIQPCINIATKIFELYICTWKSKLFNYSRCIITRWYNSFSFSVLLFELLTIFVQGQPHSFWYILINFYKLISYE